MYLVNSMLLVLIFRFASRFDDASEDYEGDSGLKQKQGTDDESNINGTVTTAEAPTTELAMMEDGGEAAAASQL